MREHPGTTGDAAAGGGSTHGATPSEASLTQLAHAFAASIEQMMARDEYAMGGADREETVEKLKRPLGALEESLAGGEYLVGGRFTVADLNVASIVANWGVRGAKLDLEEYPAVRAWAQRCGSRPAAKPPKKAKL